ncbi:hypothetical protein OPV22_027527 [Ensete ventricosum]|uniref:Uncharacterized protein n=1 Tax=Ensete ventricosum TaxID=4639 RepID=A0AAV8Q7X2_ENSVE|nr:hypothetical protein OPV22_027527 [Ensete ventricosum]
MNLSRCYGHTLLPSLPLDTARTHDAEAVTAVGWVPIQIRFLPDGVLRQARRRRPRPAPTPAFGLAVALPPKQDERTEPQKREASMSLKLDSCFTLLTFLIQS